MIRAAIVKDVQLLVRDRGALGSLFALPIVFTAVFGAMFQGGPDGGGELPRLPVHYAAGERAEGVARAIDEAGVVRPERQPSARRVREIVADGGAVAGLVIPADFDPMRGRAAELWIDPQASPQALGEIRGALSSTLARASFGGLGDLALLDVRSASDAAAPPELGGFEVAGPGNAVLFGFFIALTVALSFVEERETGTWRRVMAAPVSRAALLLSKLVPYVVVGLVQMALLFGVGAAFFGMRVAGSLPALAVLTVLVVVCAVALGLVIASFGGSSKQMGGVGSITLLVMGLLGGAMVPRAVMPETMKTIGLAVPHAWALDGYYELLVGSGAGFADVAPSLAALTAFAAVFAAFGVARFRFE